LASLKRWEKNIINILPFVNTLNQRQYALYDTECPSEGGNAEGGIVEGGIVEGGIAGCGIQAFQ
jgi:hypothetical protein